MLDADPKAIQQINFNGNLEWDNKVLFPLLKKQTVIDLLQGTVEVL